MEMQVIGQTHRLRHLIVGGLLAVCLGLLIATSQAFAAQLTVDDTTFPDDTFRGWVLTEYGLADGDVVDDSLFSPRTDIDVSGLGISTLEGIEYFTGLVTLDCSENYLIELDLSQNTLLQTLNCSQNYLFPAIDLTANTALTSLDAHINGLFDIIGLPSTLASFNLDDQELLFFAYPFIDIEELEGYYFTLPIKPEPHAFTIAGIDDKVFWFWDDEVGGFFVTDVLDTPFAFTTDLGNGFAINGEITFGLAEGAEELEPPVVPVLPGEIIPTTPATTMPPTGDNSALPIAFAALAASCGAALLIRRRVVSSK